MLLLAANLSIRPFLEKEKLDTQLYWSRKENKNRDNCSLVLSLAKFRPVISNHIDDLYGFLPRALKSKER